MYTNRQDAGRQLATKLLSGRYTADIVVGLARGGVAISREISRTLQIPQDDLVVNKIGSPENSELAVGAEVPSGQQLAIRDKRVILADDGAATGETMGAAIQWIKDSGAKKITIALPVAPPDTAERLKALADDVIVLETPLDFGAVGEFYLQFPQLTNQDVVILLL
jgi:predicted phosphoribosyltransferase